MLSLVAPLLAALAQAPAAPPAPAPRPNVLVVIADDWSWPPIDGGLGASSPIVDRLAASGVLFTNAYCAAPSCTPSRASLLTGRMPHRLGPGGNLWGVLPAQYATYPDRLAAAGYAVGQSGKGWSPGSLDGSGRTHNPAGPTFGSFAAFMKTVPADQPFCFWHGSQDPHRPYEKGSGRKAGLDPASVRVPASLPDTEAVRDDLLDYLFEVRRFDATVGDLLATLAASGRADDTMVVVTSDNGMPFPRAKANLYDAGTRVPLAVRWPRGITIPRTVDAPVILTDLAPTILDLAGLKPDPGLDGRSLLPLLTRGEAPGGRDAVVLERERHADVRLDHVGYPARALRTASHLYVRNLAPDRWPAGDPEARHSVGPFGDVDGSPTKDGLTAAFGREGPTGTFARLALAKRPAEELYDLRADPAGTNNLAADPAQAATLQALHADLDRRMLATADPHAAGLNRVFDAYPYIGPGLGERPGRPAPLADNTLSDLERRLGWRLLFDGQTAAGWTTDTRKPPNAPAKDGTLDPHGAGGYMLVHEEPAGDFVLSLDFLMEPGCNSGVFVRTAPLEPRPGKDVGFNGIEVAIDDTATAGIHDAGAIYDLAPPTRNALNPGGKWNHMVIVCNGPIIAVELNGQPVNRVDLDEWTTPNKRPDGTSHKFDVAYRDHPRKGYIGLQDHGKSCRFKNIKLLSIR